MERYRTQELREVLLARVGNVGIPDSRDVAAIRDGVEQLAEEAESLRQQLRGAVGLLDDLADVLAEVSRGERARDDEQVRDVLLRAADHANGGR